MKKIYLLLIALSLNLIGFSQSLDIPLTPANDSHWELKWSDEFSIDAKGAKWDSVYGEFSTNKYWMRQHWKTNGLEPKISIDTNVYAEDGKLIIKLEHDSCQCPFPYSTDTMNSALYWFCRRQWKMYDSLGIDYYYKYSTGCVETDTNAAKSYGNFGYIEAKIKFPYHYSFWHAFWTFVMNDSTIRTLNAAEIDIELGGTMPYFVGGDTIYNTQNYVTNGIYRCYKHTDPVYWAENWDRYFRATYVPNYSWVYDNWHTYAIEWSPTRIIWYIDNKPVRQLDDHGIVDTVRLILGLGFLDDFENDAGLANLTFPQKMEVDYVRVYGLKKECEDVFQTINYDFSNYDNTVKKKIIIGDGSSNETINTRTILRASESVEINEGFNLEEGVEFYIDVDGCSIEDIEDLMQYKCMKHGGTMYE